MIGFALRWWRNDLRNMTLQDAARAIHRDLSYLARWERAERPIPESVISELDALYGANGRLVRLSAALVDLDRYRGTVEPRSSTQREDEDMERRTLMQVIPMLGIHTAVSPEVINRVFGAADKSLGPISHDPDEWDWIVFERWHYYTTNRPGAAVPMLATDLLQVTDLLGKTETAVVRDGLTRIAAQLASLLACDLADVGQVQSAVRAFATARRFADASSDQALATWIRAGEALHSLWFGRPIAVVDRLARDAVDIANGKPSPGLMNAHCAHALVGAMQGNREMVRTALVKANEIWERRPQAVDGATDPATWTWARGPLGTQGYAHALLGEATAVHELEAAYERHSRIGYNGGARSVRLMQALHMVQNRDLEGLTLAVQVGEEMSFSAQRRTIAAKILDALPPKAKTSEPAHRLRELAASTRPAPPPAA
ncbi:helix-turn-helix transcriptional regulator [Thermopolyspora sp. NPDC052614]|uniref:helix-turn-helix domain-containing protein n=1 Tax=Thermopolyspora sp. NPDC052614 TaxID=3155682 RepID=UPI0034342E11